MKSYLTFLVVLSQLALGQASTPRYGSIRGELISSVDYRPIAEALLTLQPSSLVAQTDSLGRFLIQPVPFGQYRLQVYASGYALDTLLNIRDTAQISLSFMLVIHCDSLDAQADIAHNCPRLLIVGSIAPVGNTPSDNFFEKDYGVTYYDFGDIVPADACIRMYNETVFSYLDSKFGQAWRGSVRKDVCYIK